ncbi:MAG: sigma-54-dependent Fis family transcriptional regulator [Acidobacteriota bacterium]|nr:sigma-54-dependent Fis family transcriptional regulator [Acidobacteriota bacterium]
MGRYQLTWIYDPERAGGRPLAPAGWKVEALGPGEALERLTAGGGSQVAVLDCPIAGWSAETLLEQVRRAAPEIPVLLRDPGITPSGAVRLARLGIHQILAAGEDPFPALEAAVEECRRADLGRLAAQVEDAPWERFLVGASRPMREISQIIRLVGARRATVLITGETGTGKELAARALHVAGGRRAGPLVAVNCSALPETLLESELFGHVRGAFTGAWQSRAGRFEQANGGTIFLDEIGELPLELQSKLLRVLQEREVQRLGGSESIRLDVRVVAATNCDLAARMDDGRFREDLYYRLNVVPLRMPPLREREGDVPLLARHFLEKICRAEGVPLKRLSPEAVERLGAYPWPGNVRQLENAMETAVALSGGREWLIPADFESLPEARPQPVPAGLPVIPVPEAGLDYERTLAAIEKGILEQALRRTGGNKKAAADMLGLKRTTLSAKVRSLAFG